MNDKFVPLKDEQVALAFVHLWQSGLPEWANGSIVVFVATVMNWDGDRTNEAFLKAWQAGFINHIDEPDTKVM